MKRKFKAAPSNRIRVKMTNAMKAMSESELTDFKNNKANQVNRTRKLRLYPNKTQSDLLVVWMGHARYWYNKVVEDYRYWKSQELQVLDWEKRLVKSTDLRALRQARIASADPQYTWYGPAITRNDVIDAAMEDAVEHRKETISRNKEFYRGHNHHSLAFRSKKQPQQTIRIRKSKIKDGIQPYSSFLYSKEILNPQNPINQTRYKSQSPRHTFLPQPLHPGHVEHRKPNHHWPNEQGQVSMDSTITFRRHLGTFTFNWNYEKTRYSSAESSIIRQKNEKRQDLDTIESKQIKSEGDDNQIPFSLPVLKCSDRSSRMISMDPGVRTFQTWYSPNGECGKVASGDMGRISRLCHFMDDLQSRKDRLKRDGNAKKRRGMKFALARMRRKIRHLVDDVHWQTIHWLVTNYDTIILPDFDSTQMSQRGHRKINSRTVRQMMTWAHCRFRDRLISKLGEYHPDCGKRLIQPNEACTSITCGNCGLLNRGLGGRHVFRCRPSGNGGCGLIIDRDFNGARNIMLRALVDFTLEEAI